MGPVCHRYRGAGQVVCGPLGLAVTGEQRGGAPEQREPEGAGRARRMPTPAARAREGGGGVELEREAGVDGRGGRRGRRG